jgi:hypothetical protein
MEGIVREAPPDTLEIERERLQLERHKLELEREKLSVERSKAKWTAISISVTLVAALSTVVLGIWSQHQQAQNQFEIKAAEIVLRTDSASQALDTARALATMFPGRLPKSFAQSFDPLTVPSFGPDIIAAKTELLRLLPGKTEQQKQEIIALWKALFPDDVSFRDVR